MEAIKSRARSQCGERRLQCTSRCQPGALPAFLPGKHLVASGWLGLAGATHRPVLVHSNSYPVWSTARVNRLHAVLLGVQRASAEPLGTMEKQHPQDIQAII